MTHGSRHASDILVRRIDAVPDLLELHRANPARYPHLLESVARGPRLTRFDILFAFPGEQLALAPDGRLHGALGGVPRDSFLDAFDAWWTRERVAAVTEASIPFRGGWFIYLGYELAAQVERRLKLPRAPQGFPTALATRFPAAVVRDHERHETVLVAEAAYSDCLESMQRDVENAVSVTTPARGGNMLESFGEDDPQRYLEAVGRIHEYIRAGDVFQVNLSRAWRGVLRDGIAHADLYAALRARNPAPFAGLATWGDSAVISSSPERLVQVTGRSVQTRPIAGTRPRGTADATDRAYADELLAHPKERAEHIMLIDLERNDLGRVCEPGSVTVDELMVLESYAHVHHIVSNVRGTLCGDATPGRVIAAVFPGGTITGCPKVRCMEIIAELEGVGRGPYTGSMGYVNRDGDLDLNILIRTMARAASHIEVRAGAGIVADSDAVRELEETRAKARGMLLALGASRPAVSTD